MKLAVMQPYFFPYVGYFQLIHASERFVFYDDVNYIKNGWINRNRFLFEGEPRYFTVPLSGASPFTLIRDIRVQPTDQPWRRKLVETMRVAYKGAPHRDEGLGLLEATLAIDAAAIADFARHSVKAVMAYLGLDRETIDSSAKYGNESLHGEARILDICRRESATVYVNAPGGRTLYDTASFRAAGIDLRFVHGRLDAYPQPAPAFVPGLSILDAIMRCPRATVAAMLGAYELIA
jgi:hypothetical protein